MEIQIKEVTRTRELRTFVHFPFTLYRDNPYWVPPLVLDELNTLRKDKNPAFEHCEARYWLAYKDGKVVGRIAAIINRLHEEKWNQHYMRIGWIDFIDDAEVSAALFKTVEDWARERGMDAIHGPLGFTDMDREGMLVEGFDEIATMIGLYNYPYYPEHLERLGYLKDTDWVEYEMTVPSEPIEPIAKAAKISLRRYNLHLLEANSRKDLLPYAHQIFDLLNIAYSKLYGFVLLSPKQIDLYIKQYFDFVSPEYVPLVLDENNHLVGFGISMPSLSKALQRANGHLLPTGFFHILKALNQNDRADLYLVAVKPEYIGLGVNAIMMSKMHETFIKKGIKTVESNPELENNSAVQAQWKFFEKRQHKRRRCYIKHLA